MFFNKTGLYVWHCHMIDHEDNEIMRPMYILANSNQTFDLQSITGLDVPMPYAITLEAKCIPVVGNVVNGVK